MEISVLHYHRLTSITKSINKVSLVFEGTALFPQDFLVEFNGFTFETTSFNLGKNLLRCSDSFTLGMKSIDFLSKNRISNYSNFKQLTLEFESDGFYKNEIICLYRLNEFFIKNYR